MIALQIPIRIPIVASRRECEETEAFATILKITRNFVMIGSRSPAPRKTTLALLNVDYMIIDTDADAVHRSHSRFLSGFKS
jgi:hypothetical protein